MNKNIKLAVAGAVLALSASAANAGIIIPAGDWTLDIGGNVNAYATETRFSGANSLNLLGHGRLWTGVNSGDRLNNIVGGNALGTNRTQANITTGLLPNFLSVSGKTRQNDLDVGFTISINPGASTTAAGIQAGFANQENRQAFMTFGDKSWGSIKLGKDLGIFASDAILNDMTLLGVGSGAGGLAGNTTTTGRIGTGFIYADWKGQIAYSTPNMNGFEATVAIVQPWNNSSIQNATNVQAADAVSSNRGGAAFGYEGKASYSFAANDVAGKVWVSGRAQRYNGIVSTNATVTNGDAMSQAGDIGANINFAGFGLTGYYYSGEGIGQTLLGQGGFDASGKMRDSNGGYVQATYILPTKTKIGVSWGQSTLESNGVNDLRTLNGTVAGAVAKDIEDSMWAVGAYHPLTKHLNLVAEYSNVESEQSAGKGRGKTASVGAILFF